MHAPRSIVVAAVLTAAAGCYTAEVDPQLEATYPCEADSDCAVGQTCLIDVCSDGSTLLGPRVEILGPEVLQVFPAGMEVSVPIVIGGEGLDLQEGGGDNVRGEGHIEVRIDGDEVETITAGDLEGRVQTDPVTLPGEPGLHRVEVIARHNDGAPYQNAEARTISAFWVDDGNEHVAFLQPAPQTEVVIGEGDQLTIEVVTLNFSLVNPGLVPTDELDARGQGHIHVFFDRQIPDCLPDCNFNYESTGFPAETPVSRLIVEGGILGSSTPGTFPLAVVAQTSAHEPYYRESNPDELLYDVIDILMVEP